MLIAGEGKNGVLRPPTAAPGAELKPPSPDELSDRSRSGAVRWLAGQPAGLLPQKYDPDQAPQVQKLASRIGSTLHRDFGLAPKEVVLVARQWAKGQGGPFHDSFVQYTEGYLRAYEAEQTRLRDVADALGVLCPEIDEAYLDGEFTPLWDVEGVKLQGQPLLFGGPYKGLKTTLTLDLAVSEASATPFLGRFRVPRPNHVLYFSGECSHPEILWKLRACCEAKGVSLAEVRQNLELAYSLPNVQDDDMLDSLGWWLEKKAIRTVIFDPLYRLLGMAGASHAANLYGMGTLLGKVTRLCLEHGATPVFVHHAVQGLEPGRPMELGDFVFAGPAAFARQWFLVNRASPYDPARPGSHRLILNYGASMYPGGKLLAEIDEGAVGSDFAGRKWSVTTAEWQPPEAGKHVTSGARPAAGSADGKSAEARRQLVIDAIRRLAPGAGEEAKRKDVLTATGLSSKVLTRVIRELVAAKKVIVRKQQRSFGGKEFEEHYLRLAPEVP